MYTNVVCHLKKLMRYLILILILTLTLNCKSQKSTVINEPITELKPPFNTQGEQEDYWAQELFKKEYKKKYYSKFNGEITRVENKIRFEKVQYIELLDTNPEYNLIFEKGLLYPDILGGLGLKIGSLEELNFLSNNPKVKRFRFWLYQWNSANPKVYLFELTNDKANEKTSWKSFLKNAKLTFIKDGWIII